MRRMRMLLVLVGVFFLVVLAIPWASADECDGTEIARILCPGPAGRIYVCQDSHSGLPVVHHHCRF
jgi:hypothetical protein